MNVRLTDTMSDSAIVDVIGAALSQRLLTRARQDALD
jgi:hypothetical protein